MKAKYHYVLTVAFLGLTLILTGCSMVNTNRHLTYKREFLVNQGNPPAYVDGYVDGCSSGMRMAGETAYKYRKDAERADKDALYARGWHDGQICCRNEMLMEKQREAQKEAEKRGMAFRSIEEQRNSRVQADSRAADTEMSELWEQLRK
jgi:hypothetical protein